jgi:hypothetical protein
MLVASVALGLTCPNVSEGRASSILRVDVYMFSYLKGRRTLPSGVFAAVTMTNVFWDITPCGSIQRGIPCRAEERCLLGCCHGGNNNNDEYLLGYYTVWLYTERDTM